MIISIHMMIDSIIYYIYNDVMGISPSQIEGIYSILMVCSTWNQS